MFAVSHSNQGWVKLHEAKSMPAIEQSCPQASKQGALVVFQPTTPLGTMLVEGKQQQMRGHDIRKAPYIFKARSISMSQLGKKKACDLLKAAKHNCRELKAESGEYGRIDPTMSHLNEYLVGPRTAEEIAALATVDIHVPDRSGKAPRHDHTQAIELIFNLPLTFDADVRWFFTTCVRWAEKAFAGHQIYSAVIHYDEGPQHCHVLISPIRYGVRVGSEVIDRPSLTKLKEKFWYEVAAPAGLVMPSPKLKGARKREAVQRVMDFLSTERKPCVESRLWLVIQAAINKDPATALHLLNMNIGGAAA